MNEVRPGLQPLSGSFRLEFSGQKTGALSYDISADGLREALMQLTTVGVLDVARNINGNLDVARLTG